MPEDKVNQPGAVLDENDWNQFHSDELGANPDIKLLAYIVSKAQAEKIAWEEAERLSLSLVSINPVGVLGPVLGDNSLSAGSIEALTNVMLGVPGPADMNLAWCDTRDVAKAHIAAAETPEASGGAVSFVDTYTYFVWTMQYTGWRKLLTRDKIDNHRAFSFMDTYTSFVWAIQYTGW
jgi:nucleoside-diphosphate-sugar epimerase